MRESIERLLLGVLVMVVCFLGVENIQAKKPSMDKVELTTELEPDVRGQVDIPAGLDSISLYFEGVRHQQQEKLWLHLNQTYYAAGDTIWFKGYLADAMNHRRDTLSNFIYVDLVDQRGRFVLSKKIKRDSLGFANGIPISDTLPTGDYTLRAYTGWMLNFDPSFYYQQNLKIGSVRVKEMHTEITYLTGRAIVRFMDDRGNPFQGVEARCILYDRTGKKVSGFKQQSSVTGAIFVDFEDDSLRVGGYMEAEFEDQGFRYRKRVYFEPVKRTFTVQFLPEGGELLSGVLRRMAFKSEGSDGYPMEIHGCILNSSGDTVTTFRSEHDGMGSFFMQGVASEQYRAVCTSEDGEVKSFPLPEVKEQGSVLSVFQTQGGIRYRIDGTLPEEGFLVGHQRGKCCFVVPLEEARTTGKISTDSIGSGILHLLLTDHTGRRLSERLVFVEGQEQTRVSVATDKPAYGKRERVRIDLNIQDETGTPLAADMSVSVTNRKVISYDSLEANIKTYLLLTSDLKGYIHDPGYYFEQGGDSVARRYHLDLVMMTHGWRRFPSDNIFHPVSFTPKHFFEHGQYISGRVKSMLGRDAKSANVTVISLNQEGVSGFTETDRSGRYLLEGLDYKDTVVFLVSARNKKNRPVQSVEVDKLYPKPAFKKLAPYPVYSENKKAAMDSCMRVPIDRYFGMTGYELNEVTVTAINPRKPKTTGFDILYDTTRLAEFKPLPLGRYIGYYMLEVTTIADLKPQLNGTQTPIKQGLYIKNMLQKGYTDAILVLNGRAYPDLKVLNAYTVKDVEYINLNRTTTPYRVEVYLKPGVVPGGWDFDIHKMLGYSDGMEFYSPIYDTPERTDNSHPDNRTTLYWNPYVQTDMTGKSFVEFYTNDREDTELEISIEGITLNGIPVFHRSTLSEKKQ